MHLTLVLLRHNFQPKGHLFRGKFRLVKRVEPRHLRNLEANLQIEERNMLLLRNPYLTEEENNGHTKELKSLNILKDPGMQIIEKKKARFNNKKTVLMESVLNHLNVRRAWD